MLSFEIGQRESGFYSEWTDRQNHRVTEPSSTVLVYIYFVVMVAKADIMTIVEEVWSFAFPNSYFLGRN